MKKSGIFVLVIIIVLVGGFYLYKKQAKAPAVTSNDNIQAEITATPAATVTPNTTTATPTTPQSQAGGGENAGSDIQVTEVDFDGAKFSPDPVSINVNDYIFFKNKSSGAFWPLAGSAFTMAAYPNFNAGQPIAPGGEYKFQFTKAGNFSYGDNLHSNAVGTINVGQ